ncbi:MAG: PilZ domain-containing protein [Acidobacteria bacterium]|nr:PilZ domain-containing protein [Acidobacteriota bacterium]
MPKRILIVESGLPSVPFEESVLLRREHEVIRASSGAEALEKLRAQPYDLVIVDETLSDMAGSALASRVRKDGFTALSIILLGQDRDHLQQAAGVNKVIGKPVNPEAFREACSSLLNVQSRKDARLLVYVQVQGFIQSGFFLCNSMNLSPSGILIITGRKLKIGDMVHLQITLPREREKVKAVGRVVREAKEIESRLNAYGLQFDEISEGDRERIRLFTSEAR